MKTRELAIDLRQAAQNIIEASNNEELRFYWAGTAYLISLNLYKEAQDMYYNGNNVGESRPEKIK